MPEYVFSNESSLKMRKILVQSVVGLFPKAPIMKRGFNALTRLPGARLSSVSRNLLVGRGKFMCLSSPLGMFSVALDSMAIRVSRELAVMGKSTLVLVAINLLAGVVIMGVLDLLTNSLYAYHEPTRPTEKSTKLPRKRKKRSVLLLVFSEVIRSEDWVVFFLRYSAR